MPRLRVRPIGVAVLLVAAMLAAAATTSARAGASNLVSSRSVAPSVPASLLDSLRGRSHRLRARFINPSRLASIPLLRELFGDSAGRRAGVMAASAAGAPSDNASAFHFITMRPFADKVRGRIGSYRIGFFPGEQRALRSDAYANPEGFVEITANNQDTPVSEHFRLRDFITHDQSTVWPKYLVLREPLVDKLELVIDELRAMGVAVKNLRVMSGFRTPQYNAQGVGAGGRVQDSRHQFGDAADVYVMNGDRDWMSDLDGDGRITTRDAQVIATAAEHVERAHPEFVGGIGIYAATSAHGPFVHIDVRGKRARWGAM